MSELLRRLSAGVSSLAGVTEPAYTIKALDTTTTWAAFEALVERNNGVFGGCWCMGFHPEGVGKGTTAEENRQRKLERVRAGTTHAALVFDGDECLGWCQFGSCEELPRIKSRAAYEKERTTSPDWRIACCFVGKGHRRQGVAQAALAGALALIRDLGGGVVEGYPEDAESVPAGFLFNGALSSYQKLGFSQDRQIGKHRWVVTTVVSSRRSSKQPAAAGATPRLRSDRSSGRAARRTP
jgi:GNAT superfamily N-acetyltransferase